MSQKTNVDKIIVEYTKEKELAEILRKASKEERRGLYSLLYNRHYKNAKDNPQILKKNSPELRAQSVDSQMNFLRHFLNKGINFLEIGSGDCSLALEAAKHVKKAYAIDVSEEMIKDVKPASNMEILISDGIEVNLPFNSIDLAYSHQLMEHIHPDDSFEQLINVYNVLKKGGEYVCITPNRINGPHDISKYFDKTATCFHLKEYIIGEIYFLFKKAGFKSINIYIREKGKLFCHPPVFFIIVLEKILLLLPYYARKAIASKMPFKRLLGIRVVAKK